VSSSFFFLWRGINTSRRLHFVISGALLGLTWYTYLPARLSPLILIIFFILDWLIAGRRADGQSIWQKHRRDVLWLFAVALVVATPIGVYYLLNPSILLGRMFFLYQLEGQGSPDSALLPGLSRTLAGFGLALTGWNDPSFVFLFDRLTAVCFLIGLILALARTRQSHLFLLVWWLIGLTPTLLAASNYFLLLRRAVLAQPPVFLLAALCVASTASILARSLPANIRVSRLVIGSLTLAVLVGVAAPSYQTFFLIWTKDRTVTRSLFNTPAMDLVRTMKERQHDRELYLLVNDSVSTSFPVEQYVVEFLYNDPNGFLSLYDNEATLPTQLAPASVDKEWVSVIHWTTDKRRGADPKCYLNYLLSRWGNLVATETFADYTITTYRRTLPLGEFPSDILRPMNVTFGDQLRLVGIAYGATGQSADQTPVAAGEGLWARLRWRRVGEITQDYQVSLVVQDEGGHVVGQEDTLLLDNQRHQGTSRWAVGQEENSYQVVSIAPAIPPGLYQLRVVVYDPTDGRRLLPDLPAVGGDLAAVVGEVTVKPASTAASLAASDVPVPITRSVTPDLRLLGYGRLPEQPIRPGDLLPITLYWQAEGVPSRDYQAALWLARPGEESLALAGPSPIGGAAYPTAHWRAGEAMRQWLDAYVPATVQEGTYRIGLQVLAADTGQALGEVSWGEVSVLAREHQFSVPVIEHPVNVTLDNQIRLLGYDLALLPDRSARLALYWQALQEIGTSYKVFVHLRDEAGNIRAQHDAIPVEGQAPTTGWLVGEVLTDRYTLSLLEDAPPGTYTLLVGLYDPRTGHRLSAGGADAIHLTQFEVP
jgi:hypothetical protein